MQTTTYLAHLESAATPIVLKSEALTPLTEDVNAVVSAILAGGEYAESPVEGTEIVLRRWECCFAKSNEFEVFLVCSNGDVGVADFIGTFTECVAAIRDFREKAKVAAVAPLVTGWYVYHEVKA